MGLLELLPVIIKEDLPWVSDTRIKSCNILWSLSMSMENHSRMGSDSLGLIKLLISIICDNKTDPRFKVLPTLQNLSMNKENRIKMGSEILNT